MRKLQAVVRLTCLFAVLPSGTARSQSDVRSPIAAGTFIGRDSLDARKEAATASRVRSDLRGSAIWTIELDSLDLRQKFTLRFDVAEPSRVTIVVRFLDTLPPRPGQYTAMIASTGASHRNPGTVHADVYTRESNRNREYVASPARVVITSVTMAGGQPIVTGNVEVHGDRFADAPPKTLLPGFVWLDVRGDFAARAAADPRPRTIVTSQMQEAVLRRALDGFVITHSGAINGDGNADSTRQPVTARQFLDSRWRQAAIVDRVEAAESRYTVRLRGRHAPVQCEVESNTEEIDCVTLPAPVAGVAGGAPGAVAGRLAIRQSSGAVMTGNAKIVYLLPNPVPLKETFRSWCDERDTHDSVAERTITAKLESIKDTAAKRAAMESFLSTEIESYRKALHGLFASYSVQRVTTGTSGQYEFNRVAPGNYLLFAALADDERYYEWFVPIAIHGGERVARELDGSTVNTQEFACGTPLPFPATHGRSR